MNIFVLDTDTAAAAKAHCNKHVVKMIVETAQVLSTVLHLKGMFVEGLYKPTHRAHPCTLWAAENWANFRWAVDLGLALCAEYTARYKKRHKTQDLLEALGRYVRRWGHRVPAVTFCFVGPDDCAGMDVVESYRRLYRRKAAKMDMVWPAGGRPSWMEVPA